MKAFIIRNLRAAAIALLAATATSARACYFSELRHNMYMMNVFKAQCVDGIAYAPDFSSFWINYTGIRPSTENADDYYNAYAKDIKRTARRKGDHELMTYMQTLDSYLAQVYAFDNTWVYPTKAQQLHRRQLLLRILATAKQYRGSRLRAQYDLLRMRCNIILKKHTDNLLFWQHTASLLPASPYRDMMQNIYAGALLNSGRRHDALEVYARQEDWRSVKMALFHYLDLTGIKQIYREDANAAPLPYMVQYFVNSAQETLDTQHEGENWPGMMDYHETTPQEVNDFIAFAAGVVKAGKTRTPLLWQTAIGMLQYLYHQGDALQTMDRALTMAGTPEMKNCARCIRLLCSVAPASMDDAYCHYLQKEFDWLSTKATKMGYFDDTMDRIVFKELIPKYRKMGRPEMVTALLADIKATDWSGGEAPNPVTSMSGIYEEHIDTLSADEIIHDVKFLKSLPGNEFECWVVQHSFLNENYYNDKIGTNLLAEGRFAEAAQYLAKVPVAYICQQPTAWYMAYRRWNVEPWFSKQHNDADYWNYDKKAWISTDVNGKETCTPATAEERRQDDDQRDQQHALKELQPLKTNRKLDFANEMNQLEATYAIANDTTRQQLAYQLAVRLVQASYYGDCWWLTDDVKTNGSTRPKKKDLLTTALAYLQVSSGSTSFQMQEQSFYAMAWIPADPWYESRYEYTDDNGKTVVCTDHDAYCAYYPLDIERSNLVIRDQSSQYKCMLNLVHFADSHAQQVDTYITKCDMLRQFRKLLRAS